MEGYDFNKTARWTFYTAGAIFILLGVLSLLHPFLALVSVAVFMGIGLIITGINNLVPFFTMKGNPLRPKWLLPMGILDILFGFLFISRIGLAIFTLSTLLGLWVLLVGCLRLYIAYEIKSAGVTKWWWMLVSAVLMLLAAAVLLSHPVAAVLGVAMLTGLSLIGVGALSIAEGRILYPARSRRN